MSKVEPITAPDYLDNIAPQQKAATTLTPEQIEKNRLQGEQRQSASKIAQKAFDYINKNIKEGVPVDENTRQQVIARFAEREGNPDAAQLAM